MYNMYIETSGICKNNMYNGIGIKICQILYAYYLEQK